tara:strand:+ start:1567 stop:2364 length:798 start_codon:yes stop_codon:yes gene_type:complete
MNEGANEALQRQLQALNEKFAERLSEELAALEQHAEQLQSVREQEQRRQLMLDLHERLHRLAGTAGTFGFTTLGEQSRLLEQRAERWLEAAKPSGQALSAFVRAVNQMAAAERAGGRDQHGEMHSGMPDALPAGCRIYLLEKDFDAGQNMCQTLGNFGYEVLIFPDVPLLQSAVQGQLPDALIVSQHDGELDAISALQQSLEAPLPLLVIGHRSSSRFRQSAGGRASRCQGVFRPAAGCHAAREQPGKHPQPAAERALPGIDRRR